jgi:hypothetical protein
MRRIGWILALAVAAASAPASAQAPPEEAPPPEEPPPPPPPPAPPQAQPPQQPPPYYYYQPPQLRPVGFVKQRRWALFAIGVGVFGGAWIGSIVDALNAGAYLGVIPIAGPFLLYDAQNGTGTNVLYILDGLAQAAGVTLAILGLTLTKKVPVYGVVPTARGLAFAGRF